MSSRKVNETKMLLRCRMGGSMDDVQLLKQYVKDGSQEAFADIVRRHVDLVYGTARRLVGDEQLAEDVAQAAFAVLAQKAKRVEPGRLAGWLVNATRLAANEARRARLCREKHEWRAAQMRSSNRSEDGDEPTLEQLTPLLDEALCRLGEADRTAVAMRFLEGRSFAEVAAAMGSSEEAARKRVERAVEKLRGMFMKKGFAPSVGGMMVVLAAHQAQAAPAGLAGSISATAISGGTGVGAILAKGAMKMMVLAKVKVAAVVLGMLVGVTGGAVVAQMRLSPATSQARPAGEAGMTTHVYELTDLAWPAVRDPQAGPNVASRASGGTGSGGLSRDQLLKDLADLIRETIGLGSWEGQGAGRGTIRTVPQYAQFVITQTPAIQQAIENLLEKMKTASALQVNVEMRFVTVDPSKMPADLAEVMDGPRSAENRGKLEATQFSRLMNIQASVVTSPRVTIFNGGSAYVSVNTDRNYVSGFKIAENGYGPVVRDFSDGLWMEVGAAVAPDGREVALHVSSKATRLLGMDQLKFKSGSKPELWVQGPRRDELNMDLQAIVPDNEYTVIGKVSMMGEDEAKPGIRTKKMVYLVVKPRIISQRETDALASGQSPATAPAAASADDLLLQVYEIADLIALDMDSMRLDHGVFVKKATPVSDPERGNALATSVCDVLRKTVAPQSWREAGGSGVIRLSPVMANLVVLQTPANHALIATKLAELREKRSSQICVNVDFVAIDTDRIPPAFGQALDEQRQSPRSPPKFWPDESQVRELVALATNHETAEVRLVNGGYAEMRRCLVTPCVTSVQPTTRASEIFYETEVDAVDDGTTLQVQATATPDGSGVDVVMLPAIKRVLEIKPFAYTPKGTEDQITVQQPFVRTVDGDIRSVIPNGKTLFWGTANPVNPDAAADGTKGVAKQTAITLFRATILPKVSQ